MAKILLTLLFVSLSSAQDILQHNGFINLKQGPNTLQCGQLNGDAANYEVLPWTAHLFEISGTASFHTSMYYKYACSGALIGSQFIVTSGYCASKGFEFVQIGTPVDRRFIGGWISSEYVLNESTDIKVLRSTPHPSYGHSGNHDIGFVKLKKEIQFDNVRSPICLAREDPFRGNEVSGINSFRTININKTREIVSVETTESCNRLFRPGTHGEVICAKEAEDGKWYGDFGSPLIREDKNPLGSNSVYFLYGIGLHNVEPHNNQVIGYYTNVFRHLRWILDEVMTAP